MHGRADRRQEKPASQTSRRATTQTLSRAYTGNRKPGKNPGYGRKEMQAICDASLPRLRADPVSSITQSNSIHQRSAARSAAPAGRSALPVRAPLIQQSFGFSCFIVAPPFVDGVS
jgi:hypothetical protein